MIADTLLSHPVKRAPKGRLLVPGDKSISHRALMFGAIADGVREIRGLLEGEDCLSTAEALRALGVKIERAGEGHWRVHGVGLNGLRAPQQPLDLGNSGTGMRLLAGLLAGQRFSSTLCGDASLSSRPMRRVTEPLRQMGARIRAVDGHAPLSIDGVETLRGIDYALPVASAQVKSAILIAGLYADGETVVHEPGPSRDHTERMLAAMGARVARDRARISISPCRRLAAGDVTVPGDLSSAAFFLVAGSLHGQAQLELPAVGVNPTRRGVLDILGKMHADVSVTDEREVGGEPVADLVCRGSALRAVEIGAELVPLAIDEFPVLFVAAACAKGTSRFSGLAELRHKESDRIGVMVAGLRAVGVAVEEGEDWVEITGSPIRGGDVDSHGDHRIAMAFAIAGSVAGAPIRIRNARQIATSFPNFTALAAQAGLAIEPAS